MENYELLKILGQGQYGTAHLARHKDGTEWCMKRIPMTSKDDSNSALKEVEVIKCFDHPNVVGYKESFLHGGELCIVVQYCDEGDLFSLIRRRKKSGKMFSEDEVMNMFLQLALGLHHVHSKRILHRDLKTQDAWRRCSTRKQRRGKLRPSAGECKPKLGNKCNSIVRNCQQKLRSPVSPRGKNIFIAKGRVLKLGDFGISKVLERTDEFASTVTGTPYYMAPEVCTSQPYTYKSDIWSLGCVLYELCTLKHAFAADSLLSLVYQIVKGNFPPIPEGPFGTALGDLVNRMLDKDCDARPGLSQIFQMPFVKQHHEQFERDTKLNALKQRVLNRRRSSKCSSAPPAAPAAAPAGSVLAAIVEEPGEESGSLTPRERMRQRKMQAGDSRAAELLEATQQQRNQGHQKSPGRVPSRMRKQAELQGANAGLLLATAQPAMLHETAGSDVLLGSVVAPAAAPAAAAPSPRAYPTGTSTLGSSGVNLGTVNLATMPGSGVYGESFVNMGSVLAPGGLASRKAELRQSLKNLPPIPQSPLRTTPPQQPWGLAASGAGSVLEGSLLMGSVRPDAKARPASAPLRGTLDSSMLMGSVASGAADMRPQPARFGASGSGSGAAANAPGLNQTGDSVLLGSVMMTAAPFAQPAAIPPLRSAPEADSRLSPSAVEHVEDEYDNEEFELDEYDDEEFEDYHSEDDDEVREQVAMWKNSKEVIGAAQSGSSDVDPGVQDRIAPAAKNDRLATIQERCRNQLGQHFQDVYNFLLRVRTSDSDNSQDLDRRVRETLVQLVGRDNLSACFEVDQLIFMEHMHGLHQ